MKETKKYYYVFDISKLNEQHHPKKAKSSVHHFLVNDY